MSNGELSRLEVLRDLDQQRLTTAAACQLLTGARAPSCVSAVEGVPDGRPDRLDLKATRSSQHRRKPDALRRAVLAMTREWYWDFGPTLAAENLREAHGTTSGRPDA
jgi:hypothetical protein